MDRRWQPIPVAVASACLKLNWDKTNPAPEAVGYLWTWCLLAQENTVTRRDLARHCGWSEWKARKVLDNVLQDFQNWTASPKTAQDSPKTAHLSVVIPDSCEPVPPTYTAPRTRDPSSLQLQTTTTEHKAAKSDPLDPVVEQLWGRLRELAPGKYRLTQRTRRELKKRIKQTSPDEMRQVLEWWQTSPHPRAQWLRKGDFGMKTILKEDNFDQYVRFATAPPETQIDESDPFQALAMARHLRTQGGTHD